eukprot:TRINITY_DN5432_c1_g1_i2.p2 TRINITY_DN5432_c1_g1~~TRINITY_DN5432_c1_g1_i2.p2  ORF type:complete len:204 (+),score=-20.17 TRINITY_DN5432_c1_g1_i2:416-1027(+)
MDRTSIFQILYVGSNPAGLVQIVQGFIYSYQQDAYYQIRTSDIPRMRRMLQPTELSRLVLQYNIINKNLQYQLYQTKNKKQVQKMLKKYQIFKLILYYQGQNCVKFFFQQKNLFFILVFYFLFNIINIINFCLQCYIIKQAYLAQLVRASVSYAECHQFESSSRHLVNKNIQILKLFIQAQQDLNLHKVFRRYLSQDRRRART